MKLKFFVLFLALSLIAWAQAPQSSTAPNANPTTNSTTAPEAKGCCHNGMKGHDMAGMKGDCCHRANADAKDAMACCGDKCLGKDAKSCCDGKEMKACAKECKKAGSCEQAKCCKDGKGCCGGSNEKTAANCCGGNKCERPQQVGAGN